MTPPLDDPQSLAEYLTNAGIDCSVSGEGFVELPVAEVDANAVATLRPEGGWVAFDIIGEFPRALQEQWYVSSLRRYDMLGRTVPDVIFKTRVRDERVEGENPFRWAELPSAEVFREKRIVLFALPGAFTPTCTTEQCPAFEAAYDELRALGADDVYCLSVNDAFVMYQWGKHLSLKKLKLLPDGSADFTRRMGMLVKKDHVGFGQRSWRYASVVDDGTVTAWFEEPGINDSGSDDDPYFESSPEKVITWLKANNDGSSTVETDREGAIAWLERTPENSFS